MCVCVWWWWWWWGGEAVRWAGTRQAGQAVGGAPKLRVPVCLNHPRDMNHTRFGSLRARRTHARRGGNMRSGGHMEPGTDQCSAITKPGRGHLAMPGQFAFGRPTTACRCGSIVPHTAGAAQASGANLRPPTSEEEMKSVRWGTVLFLGLVCGSQWIDAEAVVVGEGGWERLPHLKAAKGLDELGCEWRAQGEPAACEVVRGVAVVCRGARGRNGTI